MKLTKDYLNMTRYLSIYKSLKINDSMILLESQQGKNLNGNIFYLLKELLTNECYAKYKVLLSVEKNSLNKTNELLKQYGLDVHCVIINTIEYYKAIAQVKYLITDTSFAPFFIKKEGQIIVNTWHGTPLKMMGRNDKSSFHSIGNVQKNFFISNYILFPNVYMKDIIVRDYMLENISEGDYILNGYPRNSAFFNMKNQDIIKYVEGENKQIIAYMPTWRGVVGNVNNEKELIHIQHYLLELDEKLADDQLLLVNLHPFINKDINFKLFKNIKPFPSCFETYDVLNIADTLITDYSSVFFDYAVTRRKIILFVYDYDKYLDDRGLYLDITVLPFLIARDVNELIYNINSDEKLNYDSFLSDYCAFDSADSSAQLLNKVILEEGDIVSTPIYNNGKENILIYSGNLSKNGITTALFNLLNNIDSRKYNYILTFSAFHIRKHKNILKQLPEGINYIPVLGKMNASILDKIYIWLCKKSHITHSYDNKVLDNLYKNEIKRCYGNINFTNIIQYSGYDHKKQLMFGRFECNKIIFVHSNMVKEIEVRKTQNPNAIRYAYNNYDEVAVVTEDMKFPTAQFCSDINKIKVCHSIINYKEIIEKSNVPIQFDDNTLSNYSINEVCDILDSNDNKVFITIGRFSPEKGHKRLIDAFDTFWKNNQNTYLIIIGGHGILFDETIEYALSKKSCKNIVIIRSMTNPYPILKKSDYFIFSSFYEGFGLVLAEADILKVPFISTDILGPRGFVNKYNGTLVDNSTDGLIEGMHLLLNNSVTPLSINYDKYNEEALNEFYSLLT